MHLVILETSANQGFIFASNRLAEAIGASEMTTRIGTALMVESIAAAGGPVIEGSIRDHLVNQEWSEDWAILTATSGKAIVAVPSEEAGRSLIQHATLRAQVLYPGAYLTGAISELAFEWQGQDQDKSLHKCSLDAHGRLAAIRGEAPHPHERFLQLPIVEVCRSSGLPAFDAIREGTAIEDEPPQPVSRTALAKRRHAPHWYGRMNDMLQGTDIDLPANVSRLEKQFDDLDWWSVIHADGNGIGNIFMNFAEHVEAYAEKIGVTVTNVFYAKCLAEFSVALEIVTEKAFRDAAAALKGSAAEEVAQKTPAESDPDPQQRAVPLPIVPLILGGDDFTAICDGRRALEFSAAYLRAFEKHSQSESVLEGIIPNLTPTGGLAACAGVAITKPHYPFHRAYQLVEALTASAKRVKLKSPFLSALDFHVLYDTTIRDIDDYRTYPTRPNYLRTGKPYVVSPLGGEATAWSSAHSWQSFIEQLQALDQKIEDGLLSTRQLNALRKALDTGPLEADAQLSLGLRRHPALECLIGNPSDGPPSVFVKVDDEHVTRVFDLIEARRFVGGRSS